MKRNRKITLWILAAVFIGLPLMLIICFLVLGAWANSIRLPESLKQPPAALRPLPKPFSAILPTTFTQAELATVRTTEDYYRLCLNRTPNDPALGILLQLMKRYREEKIEEEIEETRLSAYDRDLTAGQLDLLRKHAGYISQFRQLAMLGSIPQISTDDLQTIIRCYPNNFVVNIGRFFYESLTALNCQGKWRIQQKDYAGGRDCFQDALRVIGKMPSSPILSEQVATIIGLGHTLASITACVEDAKIPPELSRALLPDLEQVERTVLSGNHILDNMKNGYLMGRLGIVVAAKSGSWRSMTFGWWGDNQFARKIIFSFDLHVGGRTIHLPRIDRYVRNAFEAIHNRRNVAPALEGYDRFLQNELELARLPYPELIAAEARHTTSTYDNFLLQGDSNRTHFSMRQATIDKPLEQLAQIHLLRLAIEWRLDPAGTLKQRGEDFRGDPYHPWRDPFTERPMMLDNPTSPTIIYSAGPAPSDDERKNAATAIDAEKEPEISIHIR